MEKNVDFGRIWCIGELIRETEYILIVAKKNVFFYVFKVYWNEAAEKYAIVFYFL